eukprot:6809888-Prymnesium_polylepis.1
MSSGLVDVAAWGYPRGVWHVTETDRGRRVATRPHKCCTHLDVAAGCVDVNTRAVVAEARSDVASCG